MATGHRSTAQAHSADYTKTSRLQTVPAGTPIGVTADANACTPKESASVQKNLFLANGYVDLGTYFGVTPYIGGGVGTVYMNSTQNVNFYNVNDGSPYRATLTLPNGYPSVFYSPVGTQQGRPLNPQPHYNYGPQNWDYSQSTYKWNFAFALMAGFSYDINANLKLDLGYRYVNFGTMTFKSLLGLPLRQKPELAGSPPRPSLHRRLSRPRRSGPVALYRFWPQNRA